MSLLSFAESELQILSCVYSNPDNRPIVEEFIPQILTLVEAVASSDQSGCSMPYTAYCVAEIIKKLLLHQPITSITGIEQEWFNMSEYNDGVLLYQNRRCPGLFKTGEETTYYLDAIVFKDINKENNTFTGEVSGLYSRQYIKGLPFFPKTFYVDVEEVPYDPDIHTDFCENDGVKTSYIISAGSDTLDEIFEYYKASTEYSNYYLIGKS